MRCCMGICPILAFLMLAARPGWKTWVILWRLIADSSYRELLLALSGILGNSWCYHRCEHFLQIWSACEVPLVQDKAGQPAKLWQQDAGHEGWSHDCPWGQSEWMPCWVVGMAQADKRQRQFVKWVFEQRDVDCIIAPRQHWLLLLYMQDCLAVCFNHFMINRQLQLTTRYSPNWLIKAAYSSFDPKVGGHSLWFREFFKSCLLFIGSLDGFSWGQALSAPYTPMPIPSHTPSCLHNTIHFLSRIDLKLWSRLHAQV